MAISAELDVGCSPVYDVHREALSLRTNCVNVFRFLPGSRIERMSQYELPG